MAATATTKSARATLTLVQGTDPITAKDITKSVSLTGLRGSADPDKILNVAELAAPCLVGSVGAVTYTEVRTLSRS